MWQDRVSSASTSYFNRFLRQYKVIPLCSSAD